jgi:TetR/AcrR family transcriptional regulator
MLNWHYMWFREDGTMSREDYADLATTVLVEGAQALAAPARTKVRQRA